MFKTYLLKDMDDDAAGDDGGDDGDDEGKHQAIWNPESDFVFLIQVSEDPVHDVGSDLDQEVEWWRIELTFG